MFHALHCADAVAMPSESGTEPGVQKGRRVSDVDAIESIDLRKSLRLGEFDLETLCLGKHPAYSNGAAVLCSVEGDSVCTGSFLSCFVPP